MNRTWKDFKHPETELTGNFLIFSTAHLLCKLGYKTTTQQPKWYWTKSDIIT